jgi:hypothetical protein
VASKWFPQNSFVCQKQKINSRPPDQSTASIRLLGKWPSIDAEFYADHHGAGRPSVRRLGKEMSAPKVLPTLETDYRVDVRPPRLTWANSKLPRPDLPTLYLGHGREARCIAAHTEVCRDPPLHPPAGGYSGEIEVKNGLPSADRNNKATLLLTGPFHTAKSSAKDLTPLVLKLQYAKYHDALRAPRKNRLLRR